MIDDNNGYKFLTKEQLLTVLENIPPESKLLPNSVKNICVVDKNDTYVGYIDFLETGEFQTIAE